MTSEVRRTRRGDVRVTPQRDGSVLYEVPVYYAVPLVREEPLFLGRLGGPVISEFRLADPRPLVVRRAPVYAWTPASRAPSKRGGRRGTRRAWKRAHAPRFRPTGATYPVVDLFTGPKRLDETTADTIACALQKPVYLQSHEFSGWRGDVSVSATVFVTRLVEKFERRRFLGGRQDVVSDWLLERDRLDLSETFFNQDVAEEWVALLSAGVLPPRRYG